MAVQRLGDKKTRICSEKAGKTYLACYVRGGWEHYVAECWYSKSNADWVNWKTGEVEPYIRDGKTKGVEAMELADE